MIENFLKLMSNTEPQIEEAQRTPRRLMPKNKTKINKQKSTPRHNIFKWQKIKDEKILKEARGEKNTLPKEEQR